MFVRPASRSVSVASSSAQVTAFTNEEKGAADTTEYRLFFNANGAWQHQLRQLKSAGLRLRPNPASPRIACVPGREWW